MEKDLDSKALVHFFEPQWSSWNHRIPWLLWKVLCPSFMLRNLVIAVQLPSQSFTWPYNLLLIFETIAQCLFAYFCSFQTTFYRKKLMLQWDSNSDRGERRRASTLTSTSSPSVVIVNEGSSTLAVQFGYVSREHSPLGEASLYSPVLQGCIRLLH